MLQDNGATYRPCFWFFPPIGTNFSPWSLGYECWYYRLSRLFKLQADSKMAVASRWVISQLGDDHSSSPLPPTQAESYPDLFIRWWSGAELAKASRTGWPHVFDAGLGTLLVAGAMHCERTPGRCAEYLRPEPLNPPLHRVSGHLNPRGSFLVVLSWPLFWVWSCWHHVS